MIQAQTRPDPASTQAAVQRICSSKALPAVPAVALKTIEMCNDPDVNLGRLAKLVSSDPALAAKMLQLANSSFSAARTKVSTVRDSVVRLGLKVTRITVLAFSLAAETRRKKPGGFSIDYFWRYALTTANGARLLAETVHPASSDDAFAAGLMQDIGVLALQCAAPEAYAEVLQRQRAEPTAELWEIETDILGLTHMDVGSCLLRSWRLPSDITDPIAHHHRPITDDMAKLPAKTLEMTRFLTLAANVARLFNETGKGITHETLMLRGREEFGLSEETMTGILERVQSAVSDTLRLFTIRPTTTPSYEDIKAQAASEIARLTQEMNAEIRAWQAQAERTAQEKEALEAEKMRISERMLTDELTGTLSRHEFLRRLDVELAHAARAHTDSALMFVDIDNFKSVNDRYGHTAGDAVLRGLGDFLKSHLREEDAVARYGGDEFVVMLSRTKPEAAMKIAERLRFGVGVASRSWADGVPGITVSVGLYCTRAGGDLSKETMLDRADRCLYAAKTAGRNRTRYATD